MIPLSNRVGHRQRLLRMVLILQDLDSRSWSLARLRSYTVQLSLTRLECEDSKQLENNEVEKGSRPFNLGVPEGQAPNVSSV